MRGTRVKKLRHALKERHPEVPWVIRYTRNARGIIRVHGLKKVYRAIKRGTPL